VAAWLIPTVRVENALMSENKAVASISRPFTGKS
jgi:hypothetical protein